jgi:hypothetical protein
MQWAAEPNSSETPLPAVHRVLESQPSSNNEQVEYNRLLRQYRPAAPPNRFFERQIRPHEVCTNHLTRMHNVALSP